MENTEKTIIEFNNEENIIIFFGIKHIMWTTHRETKLLHYPRPKRVVIQMGKFIKRSIQLHPYLQSQFFLVKKCSPFQKSSVSFLSLILLANEAQAGVFSCAAVLAYYGTCQTACNAGWVTCMSGAGLVAGATLGVGGGVAAIGCSVAQGACMAACASTAAAMW